MRAEEQAYEYVSSVLLEQIKSQKLALVSQTKLLRSFLKKAPKEDYVEASLLLTEQLMERVESLRDAIKLWEDIEQQREDLKKESQK